MQFGVYTKWYACACGNRWPVNSETGPPPRPRRCPSCGATRGFKKVGSMTASLMVGSFRLEAQASTKVATVKEPVE